MTLETLAEFISCFAVDLVRLLSQHTTPLSPLCPNIHFYRITHGCVHTHAHAHTHTHTHTLSLDPLCSSALSQTCLLHCDSEGTIKLLKDDGTQLLLWPSSKAKQNIGLVQEHWKCENIVLPMLMPHLRSMSHTIKNTTKQPCSKTLLPA